MPPLHNKCDKGGTPNAITAKKKKDDSSYSKDYPQAAQQPWNRGAIDESNKLPSSNFPRPVKSVLDGGKDHLSRNKWNAITHQQ